MMDLGKIAESAFGTFTGAAIVIASMWIREYFYKRKAAQIWYEQYYIAEGIDRLVSHVRMIDVQMSTLIPTSEVAALYRTQDPHRGVVRLPRNDAHETYPLEALVRLETLLNDDQITAMITISHVESDDMKKIPAGLRSITLMSSTLEDIRTLYFHLKTIRAELLKVKVKRKSDIRNIHKRKGIKQSLNKLSKFNDEWVAKTVERDELIS